MVLCVSESAILNALNKSGVPTYSVRAWRDDHARIHWVEIDVLGRKVTTGADMMLPDVYKAIVDTVASDYFSNDQCLGE